jgi:beta-glucosidase
VTAEGGEVTLSVDGSFASKPDVAVVVFGETPYAEGQGDVDTLAWQEETNTDLALLQNLQGSRHTCSGRAADWSTNVDECSHQRF